MTVSSTVNKITVNGTGDMTPIPFTFLFFQNSHITAILNTSGVETTWIEGSDYTLTGAGTGAGTLTPIVIFPLSTTLTIKRVVPLTQEASLPSGGPLPSATLEQADDLSAMRDQQLDETFGRALVVPATDTIAGTLPNTADRASTFLAFDAQGDPIASAGDVGSVAVSTYGATLIDDIDASAARTTLGLGTAALADLLDEDDMASDSAVDAPSQQSVKAYVDTRVQLIRKTADEIVTNSSTVQDDDHLFAAVAANQFMAFKIWLMFEGDTASSNLKLGMNAPAGATFQWTVGGAVYITAAGTTAATITIEQTNTLGVDGSSTERSVTMEGYVLNGGTAGTLQLRWAQNTAEANNTTMKANSYMITWS